MTWTRLSDDFSDRPDLLVLSRTARLLHVEGLVYANRLLTDGHIPRAVLARITDATDPRSDVAELEQAGLWISTDVPNGWQIKNWAEPAGRGEAQELKTAVVKRQDQNRHRQERSRAHRSGDHSKCSTEYCTKAPRDDASDATRSVTRDQTRKTTHRVTTPRPDPARPDPKESGRGQRCAHGRPMGIDGTGCEYCAAEDAAQKRAAP